MNRNLTSSLKALALYACTEEAEHKQQVERADGLTANSVSVKNSSAARSSSVFNTEVGASYSL